MSEAGRTLPFQEAASPLALNRCKPAVPWGCIGGGTDQTLGRDWNTPNSWPAGAVSSTVPTCLRPARLHRGQVPRAGVSRTRARRYPLPRQESKRPYSGVMIDDVAVPWRAVGGVPFTVMPLNDAIDRIVALGSRRLDYGVAVHYANAYNVALADSDPVYAELLAAGDLVFTDGLPVVWVGRRLHRDVAARWSRVYGPDVLAGVLEKSNPEEPRHYFLGATPETLDALVTRVQTRWPAAKIAGFESPPFRMASAEELVERDERIVESGATLVWVGLGTPKQDQEVRRLADSVPVVALAVGAAFDFIAGTKAQAPMWMQRSGLEWVFRLATEPRRLARRYLWGNPRFVMAAIRRHKGL
jgi:N-acetylglucosaminyldiphosphoundecaprenol N-acetyl-beta-D-mannosaminyltransferase